MVKLSKQQSTPAPAKLRRCIGKTSPVAAAATAVKSRARPAAAAAQASLPPADMPLPLWASDSSDRWTMLKRLFMWPYKMVDDFCGYMNYVRSDPTRDLKSLKSTTKIKFQSADVDTVEKRSILRDTLSAMREVSMSTSFSGVDTPATAWLMIGSAICDELGLSQTELPSPCNAFAIEKHTGCQQELLRHPHSADHVFCDLEHFWAPTVQAKLDDMENKGVEEALLLPLLKSGKAVQRFAWCVKHQRFCEAWLRRGYLWFWV